MHHLTRQENSVCPSCLTISCWYLLWGTRFSKELKFVKALNRVDAGGAQFYWNPGPHVPSGNSWTEPGIFFRLSLENWCSLWKLCGLSDLGPNSCTCWLSFRRACPVLWVLWSLPLQEQEPCLLSLWFHPCAAHCDPHRVICYSSPSSYSSSHGWLQGKPVC